MINDVRLLRRDGTRLGAITPLRVSIDVDGDRDITRRLTLALGQADLARVKPLGLKVEAYDGEEPQFVGYLNGPQASHRDDVTVSVTADDLNKALVTAGYPQDILIEDTAVVDTKLAVSAVTASSELASGATIQQYCSVYGKEFTGSTVSGSWVAHVDADTTVEYRVPEDAVDVWGEMIDGIIYWHYLLWEPSTSTIPVSVAESGSPLTGDYSVTPTTTGLQSFAVRFSVDTKESTTRQSVSCTTNGTETLETSEDGENWNPYAANSSWRYLRVTITGSPSGITCGISIAGAGYAPANVKLDDTSSWRPSAGDLTRQLVLDLGSSVTSNVAYLRAGVSDADKLTRYKLRWEGSNNQAAWTLLADDVSVGCARRCEIMWTQGSYRYIRVTVLWANGPVAIRYIEIRNIVSSQPLHVAIRTLLESAGETRFDLAETRQYVSRHIAEQGKPILPDVRELADTAGMEIFRRRDGRICMRPRDDYDVTRCIGTFTATLQTEGDWRDDVINEVVGRADSARFKGTYVAGDYDASSETSTVRIGRRTKVVTFNAADTEAKLQAATKAELARSKKRTVTARITVAAIPTLEYGDIIRLVNDELGIDGYFVVDAFAINDDPEAVTYDVAMQLREVSA